MSDTGCSKIVWKQTDKNGQWSKARKKTDTEMLHIKLYKHWQNNYRKIKICTKIN